ncbi:hypothetical protein F4679DRAFT_567928 [Xylaria curta]|nr:hypothetical protein F4679DRAFT_567928 [Xylaria curta]
MRIFPVFARSSFTSARSELSTQSDSGIDAAQTARNVEILDAIGRAKAFGLCLRRIWAISASLQGRENSLPGLIPAVGMFSVPSHSRQHHEHEQCTFDFCEHSRVDFTSVAQHHEECEKQCTKYVFPLELLGTRVDRDGFTAWKLISASLDDSPSLLNSTQPYMAISHVWADGTGAGIEGPGKVNKCLYEFFCGIAREFQCEGCWWDAISIPRDDEARIKALSVMHNNYASARITLVHDLYLREWEWVNAEAACFAIAMSPWYSRGWTALELAKSRKVKILFKARNDRYLVKDLDVDILAEVPQSSPHHGTAEAIRKLRSARIQSFGDLLTILGLRDTSRPRDIPIISGLLAGVDVSGRLSQQEIYQRILRKLGKIAQGHLFHNSATMSAPGFSWCPTNILDMPMAEPTSELLQVLENGDLEGTWNAYAISSIKPVDFLWHSTHPLMHASLQSTLHSESKLKHVFLTEIGEPGYRALLVQLMSNEEETTKVFRARFIGPVYFQSALGSNKSNRGQEIKVRIGNTERMQELNDAWKYICDTIRKGNSLEDTANADGGAHPEDSKGATRSTPEEDDTLGVGQQGLEALLYLTGDAKLTSQLLFQKPALSNDTSPKSAQDEMSMFFVDNQNLPTSLKPTPSFLFGNEDIIPHVKQWLLSPESEVETGRMMLLVLDENDVKIKLEPDDFHQHPLSLLGKALELVMERGKQVETSSLVTLLLDHGAPYIPNAKGEMPLHLAVENNNIQVVQALLTNERNPADPKADNVYMQSAIHLAAKDGHLKIVELLVEKMSGESLDAPDKIGQTALIMAAENGGDEIAELLLRSGASPNVRDYTGHIALHYAAKKGYHRIVQALLKHSDENHKRQTEPESSQPVTDSDDGKNKMKKQPWPDILNTEEQTALHLAAQSGQTEVVNILLDNRANPFAKDSKGHSVLLLAAKNGHTETVERSSNPLF